MSDSDKQNSAKRIINFLLPVAFVQDDIDRAMADYFLRVAVAASGIGMSYLFLVIIIGIDVPPRWLMSMALLWFPIAYSMKATLEPQQDAYNNAKELRRQLRFWPGVCAMLATIWLLSMLPDSSAPFATLVSATIVVSYLLSLWNITVLAVLINWRFFDRGGLLAASLSIIVGIVWVYFEHN